jgi:rubrerythrin
MEVNEFLRSPRSRRAFLRGAGITFAAGAPGLLAACGGDDEGGSTTAQPGSADIAVLNTALDIEYTAVAVYTAGAPLLRGQVAALGRQFREQEQEHAAALVQAIKQLGGTPNRPRASYAIPRLVSQTGALRFITDFEMTAVGAYLDALPKLSDPPLRATAAAILTNEAEHIAVLLGALDKPQAPQAFVTGESS